MYRQKISKKTSPLVNSTPISKTVPTSSYGSLSSIVQRAQQDVDSINGDERQQLESAIGTKATGEVLMGKQWVPEFKGVSSQLWGTVPLQAKLTIGEVGDKYEQEADRVAASVVEQINCPATVSTVQSGVVQQKEEALRMKPMLQRREAIAGGEASAKLSGEINRARGGGQSLDAGLQKSMGQAMGADFSGVRVHRSARADSLNQSLGARAFTTGRDLFFRKGEYQPGSRQGQKLIAHELTHVVQQTPHSADARRNTIQRLFLDNRDRAFERSIKKDFFKEGFRGINTRSRNLKNLVKQVYTTQKVLDKFANGVVNVTQRHALNALLTLQKEMEKWRYEEPREYEDRGAEWSNLNLEVKAQIEQITNAGLQGAMLTGQQLATEKEAELQSLAMRVVAQNAPHYGFPAGRNFATSLAVGRTRRHVPGTPKRGLRMPNPITGQFSDRAIQDTERDLEGFGSGVCNEFAQAAANKLRGHNVRVEIMSSARAGHTYVVLGRAQGSQLNNHTTWGPGCVIVDAWWGAIKWGNYNLLPRVIYDVNTHIKNGNIPQRVDYDG